MTDAAVASIVTGVVTVTTIVIGFLTMYVKLRYGNRQAEEAAHTAAIVESKLDNNTTITEQTNYKTNKVVEDIEACNEERTRMVATISDHHNRLNDNTMRINSLETQMAALKSSVDVLTKGIDSTRHELRSSLQTVVNKLDLLQMQKARPTTQDPE